MNDWKKEEDELLLRYTSFEGIHKITFKKVALKIDELSGVYRSWKKVKERWVYLKKKFKEEKRAYVTDDEILYDTNGFE